MGAHRLKRAVLALAAALDHEVPPEALSSMDAALTDFDLEDDGLVPGWILEFLSAWAAQRPSAGWVAFKVEGMESSDTLEFLRYLHEWAPVSLLNEGERWTFTAPGSELEAIISFEASAYLIKPTGEPEPGESSADPLS